MHRAMFSKVLIQLDLSMAMLERVCTNTPEGKRFQKFTVENPPPKCQTCNRYFPFTNSCTYCETEPASLDLHSHLPIGQVEYNKGEQRPRNTGKGELSWTVVHPRGHTWRREAQPKGVLPNATIVSPSNVYLSSTNHFVTLVGTTNDAPQTSQKSEHHRITVGDLQHEQLSDWANTDKQISTGYGSDGIPNNALHKDKHAHRMSSHSIMKMKDKDIQRSAAPTPTELQDS